MDLSRVIDTATAFRNHVRLCAGESYSGDDVMSEESSKPEGPFKCEFCGTVSMHADKIEKCRELCRKLRALDERNAEAQRKELGAKAERVAAQITAEVAHREAHPVTDELSKADPQTPEVLETEKDAGPAAAAARGELRPVPMRVIPAGAPARMPATAQQNAFNMPAQFINWARLGYRVCHEHKHGEPGKDPEVVILILAR